MSGKSWAQDDEQLIELYRERKTNAEISQILGRSLQAVAMRLSIMRRAGEIELVERRDVRQPKTHAVVKTTDDTARKAVLEYLLEHPWITAMEIRAALPDYHPDQVNAAVGLFLKSNEIVCRGDEKNPKRYADASKKPTTVPDSMIGLPWIRIPQNREACLGIADSVSDILTYDELSGYLTEDGERVFWKSVHDHMMALAQRLEKGAA